MVEVVMEAVVDEEVDNIVGKCQILYTDQNLKTRFYSNKSYIQSYTEFVITEFCHEAVLSRIYAHLC